MIHEINLIDGTIHPTKINKKSKFLNKNRNKHTAPNTAIIHHMPAELSGTRGPDLLKDNSP